MPLKAAVAGNAEPPSWAFVRPGVDVLLAGGLSLTVYFVFLIFGPELVPPSVVAFAAAIQWIINWPHFSATNYRLFRVAENRREFPVTTYVIPWVVLAAVAASFRWQGQVAPYFIKFFMIWSPYHFTAQSLGISLLYARRAGYNIGPWERRFLSWFVYGAFLVSTARAEMGISAYSYYGVSYPTLGVPEWLYTALSVAMYGGGALFAASALRRWGRGGSLPPYILAVVAGAQFVWFVVGYQAPVFYIFVPAFHSLQYLLIAWVMEQKESGGTRSPWAVSLRWYGINLIGGGILFWGLPRLCTAMGIQLDLATAVVIAGVQIHHFFVDGVIWKLKNPRVANPLSVAWPTLTRGRAAA